MQHRNISFSSIKVNAWNEIGEIPNVDTEWRAPTQHSKLDLDSNRCNICYYKHTIIGCDPCKFLLDPNGLFNTEENLANINFFEFFGLEPSLDVDTKELHQLHIKYQGVLHPDKFVMGSEEI